MPVEIRVDAARGIRISSMSGTVSDADLLEAYERLIVDPDYDATIDDLVDTTAVVRVAATPDGIRRVAQLIARLDERQGRTKVALVAPGGPAHVMAKLYTFYRDAQGSPMEHRVFRTLWEAQQWLGVGDEAPHPSDAENRGATPFPKSPGFR